IKKYSEHCCVPLCSASAKFNGILSFHAFPTHSDLRRQRLVNIPWDHFTITSHTRVCSRHFASDQLIEPTTLDGRRRLIKGAVPTLFEWNGYKVEPPRRGVWERTERRPELFPPDDQEEHGLTIDHDYCSVPEPSALDIFASRFAGSDTDIRFYTSNIFPFVFTFQRQLLQPIDEFFLFLVFLSVGLKERDLAHRFNIHQSTVSRIIATWTNFLATALGSQCIWLTCEEVQAYLPEEFKDFSDTQMILDCTELRCQTPSSPLLQSEMYSSYKSHCTMKALVGIAPHGPVTFISNLYADSVSDKELFKQSGIAEKLTEDMAVMVDKGFLITDCCKCKVYCPPFLSKCQTPSSPLLQSEMYSSYKSHCTMKALVGIAPHGPVTFISNLYAGSVSDKELFKQSGIAEKLTEDMAVMVDKGFLITDCCKCKVYCPPFLSKQKQMPAYQVKETQAIARLRVHVERVIRRIKQNKLFDSIITMSHVYNINQLFAVACMLSNYQNTALVKKWVK
uniref:THAP-type domain-containing protein n=1 Tax=Oreochromis aureus TaxID=47969 RepID=A0AAZ1XJ08_OREAU